MNNGNVGQYGPDGKFNFVDFSKVTSTADATRNKRPAEKNPEQKLADAIAAYKYYTQDSVNGLGGGLTKAIRGAMNPTGLDITEMSLRANVENAYNEYNTWKANQEAETPTTTDTDTTVKEETTTEATTPEEKKDTATTSDTIEYTYKPGDTFGQVIKNLGLESGSGLWGANGDVEYYTKQLEDQLWNSGVWAPGERQNIPVGTTIRLSRRPIDPALQEYYKKYGYKG